MGMGTKLKTDEAHALIERLAHERTRQGLSREELAERSGLAHTTIYNLENRLQAGGTQLGTLMQYGRALGLELRWAKPRK